MEQRLAALKKGARVNLEQPLTAGKEFGGHFVLGHVDTTDKSLHLTSEGENWWLGVEVPEISRATSCRKLHPIDGISLTVVVGRTHRRSCRNPLHLRAHQFTRTATPGDAVTVEGDVLGKICRTLHGSAWNTTRYPHFRKKHLSTGSEGHQAAHALWLSLRANKRPTQPQSIALTHPLL